MLAATRSTACIRAPAARHSAVKAPLPASRALRTVVRYKDDGEMAKWDQSQKEYKANREERYGGADHGAAANNESDHGAHNKYNSNNSGSSLPRTGNHDKVVEKTKDVAEDAKEGAENILDKIKHGVEDAADKVKGAVDDRA